MDRKNYSVLIVDDSPQNISIINEILKNEYSVRATTNGIKALKIAQSESPPDLILLDIMMPEMDGLEVLKKLKEHNHTREIPVCFITAKDDMDDRIKGSELGISFYITKPVNPVHVRQVVDFHFAGQADS